MKRKNKTIRNVDDKLWNDAKRACLTESIFVSIIRQAVENCCRDIKAGRIKVIEVKKD